MAQQPAESSPPPGQIKVRVELVNVDVSVTDAHGNFVGCLKKENFRILDEGAQRPITYFASIEAPAQVLVLVETSPAVYLIQAQHLAAAGALLEGLAQDDLVALASYDQTARVLLPFTDDKAALAQALGRLEYNLGSGELNFFDAVSATLDWLAPVTGKKALVLLSTGLDTSPPARWDALAEKLRASDVIVFPVALGGPLRSFKQKKKNAASPDDTLSFEQSDRALQSLAKITGGRAWFPAGAADFASMYRQVAVAVRHLYILGFEPALRDGRFHTIAVDLVGAEGQPLVSAKGKPVYHLSAREGYRAPKL